MSHLRIVARVLLILLAIAALPAVGERASLVADLHSGTGANPSSNSWLFTRVGQRAVFFAEDSAGFGLWTTNGTPAGTRQLLSNAWPAESVGRVGGSYLWFAAQGDDLALWRTGGTPATTLPLVEDLVGPDSEDYPIPWVVHGGKLYFFRLRKSLQLWTSDGAGTRLAARLPQVDGRPMWVASSQGVVFFFTAWVHPIPYDTHHSYDHWALWRSDGTAAGTRLVATLPDDVSAIYSTTRRLLFWCSGQLWASDGTARGTSAIFGPPRDPDFGIHLFLGTAGDKLYFVGYQTPSGSPERLWASDGTRRGTRALSPAAPAGWQAAVLGDRIFFVASDGVHGNELWSSRGTPETTAQVMDLCPGSCSAFTDYDSSFAVAGGKIFFLAETPAHGKELFVSDGTAAGTRQIHDLCPGPCGFTAALRSEGGEVYFYGRDPAHGVELWASDGTDAGTRRLTDFAPADPFESTTTPQFPSLAVLGSRVVTSGYDPQSGWEPWIFNRDGSGGELLADIHHGGEPGSDLVNPVAVGDRLLLTDVLADGTAAVWSTQGSAATTVKLGEMQSQLLSGEPRISPAGALAYLNLGELWKTDGTPGGTARLTSLGPGREVTSAVVSLAGQAFFAVSDSAFATELWSTDGTPAGTRPRGITLPFFIHDLTAIGDRLYFWGNDGQSGWEIWTADASLTGIRRLTDLDDHLGMEPPGFARSGNLVYFLLPELWGGSSLWRTDGTREGTAQVPNPRGAGGEQKPVAFLPRTDGTLLLLTHNGLWRTDGTAAGTVLLRDFGTYAWMPELIPGDGSSALVLAVSSDSVRLYGTDGTPQGTTQRIDFSRLGLAYVSGITRAGGHLFFAAGSDWDDNELWTSDGTQGTTRRFQEIAPGAPGSQPQSFAVAGSRLYFTADDGLHGRELWSLPLDDLQGPCRPSATALCLGQGRFRAELFYHDRDNRRGDAYAVPWSASSGAFWFYDYGNPEAVVKLTAGTPADGSPALFFGPLTDSYLALTVTDLTTGETRRYPGEPGSLPAFADLTAFPPAATEPAALLTPGPVQEARSLLPSTTPCVPAPTRLCLYNGRFVVELRFQNDAGVEELARAFAHGERAGYFAFGDQNDVEAAFKLLDGRALNGRFWLFSTTLTSRRATLTITDTLDGTVHAFTKPEGPPSSFIDMSSLR